LRYHKLKDAQDPNFASVRVNRDIRLIVHRSQGSLLVCYVDHHAPTKRVMRNRWAAGRTNTELKNGPISCQP
ncbi:MAG: hypothetical protein U9R05_10820, partial [Chloroflexota bacterium]|nr:hypothetical protein [Chloroflexota bacterium]